MNIYDSLSAVNAVPYATLPFRGRFFVAGTIWSVSSNGEEILQAMNETFQPVPDQNALTNLSLYLSVDFVRSNSPRWDQPYFRSLDHMYYGTYGPADAMLVDLLGRRVIGSFSTNISRDLVYWKRFILPSLLGIASSSIGLTPLHCACLARDGFGLLLAGASGAGKSTLALALSLNGFDYISDDCTYLSRGRSELRGWGLPTPVKLLPDAARFFPALCDLQLVQVLNGERAFEVDPTESFGVRRSLCCEPRWLIFIERDNQSVTDFQPIDAAEAASRLASDVEILPPCLSWQREHQQATIADLASRGAWVFRYASSPASAAEKLLEFCKP